MSSPPAEETGLAQQVVELAHHHTPTLGATTVQAAGAHHVLLTGVTPPVLVGCIGGRWVPVTPRTLIAPYWHTTTGDDTLLDWAPATPADILVWALCALAVDRRVSWSSDASMALQGLLSGPVLDGSNEAKVLALATRMLVESRARA